jgi:hypothetical protein
MPVTTTTLIGRGNLEMPDLGYQGGSALHALVTAMFTELSNNQDARWSGGITLADTATQNIAHNFDLALTNLTVRIVESGSIVSLENQENDYAITQVDTDTIQVQNTSGGSKTFEVYVWAYDLQAILGKYRGNVSTTDATITTILTLPVPTDKTQLLDVNIVGRDSGGADSAVYSFKAMAENSSGTVTVSIVSSQIYEDVSGWDATVTTSGSDVLVRVTGAAATNVDWNCATNVTYF